MTHVQKRRLSWGAALGTLAIVVVVIPPVRGVGMRLLDMPTNESVQKTVSDSLTAFRHDQAIRDAMREQNQRLRDTLIMGKLDRLICMHDRDCPTSQRIR